jgi:hypothetical protein
MYELVIDALQNNNPVLAMELLQEAMNRHVAKEQMELDIDDELMVCDYFKDVGWVA